MIHPILYKSVLRRKTWFKQDCKFMHVQGTKRKPVHKSIPKSHQEHVASIDINCKENQNHFRVICCHSKSIYESTNANYIKSDCTTYLPEDYSSPLPNNTKLAKFLLFNVQGMSPSFSCNRKYKLKYILKEYNKNKNFNPIISFTETWVKPTINNAQLNKARYLGQRRLLSGLHICRALRKKKKNCRIVILGDFNLSAAFLTYDGGLNNLHD